MRMLRFTLLATIGLLLTPAIFGQQGPLKKELAWPEAKSLVSKLQPSNKDAWRQVPWKISVLDAQRAASAANKPIFIWAMDGHPLGCT